MKMNTFKNDLKNKNSIIFDFDGVIADTDKARYDVLAIILKKYNIDLNCAVSIQDLAGYSTRSFLINKFPLLEEREVSEIVAERRKLYLDKLDKYCKPFDLAIQTISDLYKVGFDLAIATTNDQFVMNKIIHHLGIANYFTNVFTRDVIETSFNKVKNYDVVLNKWKKKADQCIAIEDSYIGFVSANAAGIFTIKFGTYTFPQIDKVGIQVKDYYELRRLFELKEFKG